MAALSGKTTVAVLYCFANGVYLLYRKFTKDEVLTIVSIYWFNQCIVTSQRYYRENLANPEIMALNEYANFLTLIFN